MTEYRPKESSVAVLERHLEVLHHAETEVPSPTHVLHVLRTLILEYDVRKVKFNVLRHTFASLNAWHGGQQPELQPHAMTRQLFDRMVG